MSRILWAAAVGALTASLSACGSGGGTASPTVSVSTVVVTTTLSSPTPGSEGTSSSGATAATQVPTSFHVGDTIDGKYGTVTLLQVMDPYTLHGEKRVPAPGQRWFGYRVDICVNSDAPQAFQNDWSLWSVSGPHDTVYTASANAYADFPLPQIPYTIKINPGECVNGWMVDAVPTRVVPKSLKFSPLGTEVWKL